MRYKVKAKKKKTTEMDAELSEVPGDFICVDQTQKPLVFDFLRDFNQALREQALIHLRLCLHCRELAATVLKINKYLEAKSGSYLHEKRPEIAVETETVSFGKIEDDEEQERYATISEGDTEADFSIS